MKINLNFKLLIITAMISIILMNCKSTAVNRYNENIKSTKPIFIDSINYLKSEKIKLGEFLKNKIEKPESKLFYYKNSNTEDKIVSNYNNYTVEISEKGIYHFEIESLCNCFGFNKFLFVPLIEFENNNIENNLLSTRMLEPTWSLPARLSRVWKVKINKPITLNFAIYSDNSNLDKLLYKSSSMESYGGNGYSGLVQVESEIKAGFKGKYRINISKN